MPGIPLLNLGVGLGGLTQGFNQARQQGMQQQLQELALRQYLSSQNASRLAGLGLQAGLLDQGGGGGVIQLPSGGGAQPLPTVSPAQPAGDIAVTPAGPGAAANPGTQYFGAVAGPMAGDDTPSWAKGVGGATSMTGEGAPEAKSGPQVTETPDTMPAPGPYLDANGKLQPPGTGGIYPPSVPGKKTAAPPDTDTGSAPPPPVESHVSVALPGGQQLGVPDFFRVLDTTKVAQGLARLAPHADPADIYAATSDLLKLSNGNKTEQLQAAYLAKLMDHELQVQSRENIAGAGIASREKIVGEQIGSREKVAGEQINSREKIAGNTQNRIDRRQQIAIDARAAAAQKKAQDTGQGALAKQISAIRGQMAAIKPADGTNLSEEQQKQLVVLSNQLQRITDRLEQYIPPQK